MHYSPKDLKLVPLKEVPPGTLAELVGRQDIPLVLRLTDKRENEGARILILGGSHSFDVASWGDEDASVRVIATADELRIKPNDVDADGRDTTVGALTMYEGGAFITTAPRNGGLHGVQIDPKTWNDLDAKARQGRSASHLNWELGKVDHKGEFVSLFKRENKKAPQ